MKRGWRIGDAVEGKSTTQPRGTGARETMCSLYVASPRCVGGTEEQNVPRGGVFFSKNQIGVPSIYSFV